MKYRKMICQDEGITKGWWYVAEVDLRKRVYKCGHCQKEHLVKAAYEKDGCIDKRKRKRRREGDEGDG